MITPNRARTTSLRYVADASFIAAKLAPAIDAALEEIANPTGRQIQGIRGKGNISDPTGMSVAQREEAIQRIIEDEIEVPFESIGASFAILMRFIARFTPTTEKITDCNQGQFGKDGAHHWGEPLCTRPSVKSGLCSTHYQAWYRWRRDTGRSTDDMFQPAVTEPTQ